MSKLLRFVLYVQLLFITSILVSCTGIHLPETLSWNEIPIADIKHVAGKWEGMTWSEPRTGRQDDLVKVLITEEGQFKFASYRLIGVWLGTGTLNLENGKLVTESNPDTGSATFTLHESHGKLMLKVQGVTKTGVRQVAELTPVEK